MYICTHFNICTHLPNQNVKLVLSQTKTSTATVPLYPPQLSLQQKQNQTKKGKSSGWVTSQALLSQREAGVQRGSPHLVSKTEPAQPQCTVSLLFPSGHLQQAVHVSWVVNEAITNM